MTRRTLAAAAAATLAAAAAAVLSPAGAQPTEPSTLTWKTMPTTGTLPPRQETTFARCGAGKFCLVGGRAPTPVGVLDIKTKAWVAGAKPPMPLHHFQATTGPDGCLWAAGAFTGPYPTETAVPSIYIYCAETDKWTEGPTIPRARGGGGAAWAGGKLYLASGNVGGHAEKSKVVPWVDSYDPVTKKWAELADIPNPRDHFGVGVVLGKLVAAGGRDSGAPYPLFLNLTVKQVDVLDLKTMKWLPAAEHKMPDLPTPRAASATAIVGTALVLAGGEGHGKAFATTELLNVATGRWVTYPDLAEARHGVGAASCGGAVYVTAGSGQIGAGKPRDSTEVLSLGPGIPAGCAAATGPGGGSVVPANSTVPVASPMPPAVSPAAPTPTATPTPAVTVTPAPAVSGTPAPTPVASPTPVAVASETPVASDEPACFPASASVLTPSGLVPLATLSAGDDVTVVFPGGATATATVTGWSHRSAGGVHPFVGVYHSGAGSPLLLSAGHLVRVGAEGRLVPARSLVAGDRLTGASAGSPVTTVTVTRVTPGMPGVGLYHPHVSAGELVVGGVAVTEWTDALPLPLARAAVAAARAAATLGVRADLLGGAATAARGVSRATAWATSSSRSAALGWGGLAAADGVSL
ncbi:hypothetical protein I4F81_010127 [Pyropia yezoensis]|uniref:Uncharacterized protein n=1 Tax=Pyropia yezoensis TaxID=2788 RepID=A0ACC3CBR6_PYRYE|nr:hypothetical protein I4F81_010127 [Neopyropia yezoensis]